MFATLPINSHVYKQQIYAARTNAATDAIFRQERHKYLTNRNKQSRPPTQFLYPDLDLVLQYLTCIINKRGKNPKNPTVVNKNGCLIILVEAWFEPYFILLCQYPKVLVSTHWARSHLYNKLMSFVNVETSILSSRTVFVLFF